MMAAARSMIVIQRSAVLILALLALASGAHTIGKPATMTVPLWPAGLWMEYVVVGDQVNFTVTTNYSANWFAVGFSQYGNMAAQSPDELNSTCVMAIPSVRPQVQQYLITNETKDGFVPHPSHGTGNFSYGVMNGLAVMNFTRQMNNGVTGDAQINPDGPTFIIFAVGTTPKIEFYVEMSFSTITIKSPPPPPPPSPPSPPPPSPGNGTDVELWDGGLWLDYDVEGDVVHFVVTSNHTDSWFGFGLSDKGLMAAGPTDLNSTCVLAIPAKSPPAAQYVITGFTSSSFQPHTQGGFKNITYKVEDGLATLSFSRPFESGIKGDAQISKSGATNVIFAVGTSASLSNYIMASMKSMSIDFSPAPPPPSPPSPPPPSPPSPEPSQCTPVQNRIELEEATLYLKWTISKDCRISMEVTLTQKAWFAVGLSDSDGEMVGTDAFIAHPTESDPSKQVAEYYIEEQSFSGIHFKNPLKSSLTKADNATIFTFERNVYATQAYQRSFSLTGKSCLVYAIGDSYDATQQHKATGKRLINFQTGESSTVPVPPLKKAHGALMTVGMGIILPLGAMCARFMKERLTDGLWFKIHKWGQTLGLVLCLIGFALAVKFTADGGGKHFANTHAKLGLAAVCLAVLQPLNALFRGKKGAGTKRLVWEATHILSGWAVIVLSVAAICLGLQRIGASEGLHIGYYVIVASLGALFVVGVVVQLKGKSSGKVYFSFE